MAAADEITVDVCAEYLTAAGFHLEHLAADAGYRVTAALHLVEAGLLEGEAAGMVGRLARLI